MILFADAIAICTTLTSAWLWFRASRQKLRRIVRDEALDAADLNRIIVTINRAQNLNTRAAIATAASAAAVAFRVLLDVWPP